MNIENEVPMGEKTTPRSASRPRRLSKPHLESRKHGGLNSETSQAKSHMDDNKLSVSREVRHTSTPTGAKQRTKQDPSRSASAAVQTPSPYSQQTLQGKVAFTEGQVLRRSRLRPTLMKFQEVKPKLEERFKKRRPTSNMSKPILVTLASSRNSSKEPATPKIVSGSVETSAKSPEALEVSNSPQQEQHSGTVETNLFSPKKSSGNLKSSPASPTTNRKGNARSIAKTSPLSVHSLGADVVMGSTPNAVNEATRRLVMSFEGEDSPSPFRGQFSPHLLEFSPTLSPKRRSERLDESPSVADKLKVQMGDLQDKVLGVKYRVQDTVDSSPLTSPESQSSTRHLSQKGALVQQHLNLLGSPCSNCIKSKKQTEKLEAELKALKERLRDEKLQGNNTSEIESMNREMNMMKHLLDGKTNELEHMQKEHIKAVEETRQEHFHTVATLESEIETLKAQMLHLSEELTQVTHTLETRTSENMQVQEEVDQLRDTLVGIELESGRKEEELSRQSTHIQQLGAQLAVAQEEKQKLELHVGRLEQSLEKHEARAQNRLEMMEGTIQMNESLSKELEEARQKVEALERDCEELSSEFQKERDRLGARLEEARCEREERDSEFWEERESQLREELQIKHMEEVVAMTQAQEELRDEIEVLEKRAEKAEVELLNAQRNLKVERRKSEMHPGIMPSETTQEDMQRLETLETQLEQTLARVEEYRSKARDANAKIDRLQEHNKELIARLESAENIRTISAEELSAVEQERDSALAAHNKLCVEHRELVAEREELLSKVEDTRESLSSVKRELALAVSAHSSAGLLSPDKQVESRSRWSWIFLFMVTSFLVVILFGLYVVEQLQRRRVQGRFAYPT